MWFWWMDDGVRRRKNLDKLDICTQPLSIICYRRAWHYSDHNHNGIIISASQTSDAIRESRVTGSNKQLPLHCGYINYIMWKSSTLSWSPTPSINTQCRDRVVTLPENCWILKCECIDWLHLGGWWLGNNNPSSRFIASAICIQVLAPISNLRFSALLEWHHKK